MFDLKLQEDEIIMKLSARKPISHKEIFFNTVGNLLTGAGSDLTNKVNLILTDDCLYLEYKGQASTKDEDKTIEIVKLNLNKITQFDVESNNLKEVIKIKANDIEYDFIRDNNFDDNLSLVMAKIIEEKSN